jgi:5-formyltetrahydrofolate cyclo-ligase
MACNSIRDAKTRIRRAVAESLLLLTPSHRRAASVMVAQRLASVPSVRAARTLMIFLSLPTEIDTWPVIRWAWQEGKRVTVPRIEPVGAGPEVPLAKRDMVAVLLRQADIEGIASHPDVRPGAMGISEVPDAPAVPVTELDVLVMPCQAVDRAGNRLGKGGGFYDRFLSLPDLRAERIVAAYHEQIFDEVPVAATDQPIDRVVTDGEVLIFNRPRT